jgi:hypothetical protein
MKKAINTSSATKSVGIADTPTEAIEQVGTQPASENKRKAVEVLAAVFGGESEKIADGQREESSCMVNPMSEN